MFFIEREFASTAVLWRLWWQYFRVWDEFRCKFLKRV